MSIMDEKGILDVYIVKIDLEFAEFSELPWENIATELNKLPIRRWYIPVFSIKRRLYDFDGVLVKIRKFYKRETLGVRKWIVEGGKAIFCIGSTGAEYGVISVLVGLQSKNSECGATYFGLSIGKAGENKYIVTGDSLSLMQ